MRALLGPAGRRPAGQPGRRPRRPARLPGPAPARLRRPGTPRRAPRRAAAAAVPGLVEPLTARELEVLRLLAAGKPNQRIAQRAGGQPRHGQKARQPPPGQARRGQPHRGRRPGPAARPDPLARRLRPIPGGTVVPGPARRHCRASGRRAEDFTAWALPGDATCGAGSARRDGALSRRHHRPPAIGRLVRPAGCGAGGAASRYRAAGSSAGRYWPPGPRWQPLYRRRPRGQLHPDPRHGSARIAATEDSTPKPTIG